MPYVASFDRQTKRHAATAGPDIMEIRYVVDVLLKMLTPRAPALA